MSMMDMMGGPPPGMGGPPPMGQSGPPPEAAPEEGPSDPLEILRALIALTDDYRAVEQDDEDLLMIEKVRTLLQQLLANNQKMQDEMLGGKMIPKMMRKSSGGY